jgi:hypothetical protein
MLWFDNDPKADLETKVQRAAEYYHKKYGKQPTICFVHPSMLTAPPPKTQGVELRSDHWVQPHHFWLSVQSN